MADLSQIMEALAAQSDNAEQLTKTFKALSAAKKEAFAAGDIKLLTQLRDMEKAVDRLVKATEKKKAVEDEMRDSYDKSIGTQKESIKLNDKQIESYRKVSEEHEEATKNILAGIKAKTDAHDKEAAQVAKYREEMAKYAKEHTFLGKAYAGLTGSVGKLAAGFTAGALAVKAWTRHLQAAEVRQNIIIQSFTDLDRGLEGTKAGYIDTAKEIDRMSVAMAKAESMAIRMGVSTDAVGDTMVRFSRIVGSKNPEALGTLTEAAISTSRALGITVPEAVDYVSTRMDKFGGSAAQALVSLAEVREESEHINKAFGRTIMRGNDIVKVLQDISVRSNVYAIDQRLVGSILRDNIARLMATGESYDQARRKAEAFTKGVTGDAPEWMQILAGEDILASMSGLSAAEFEKKFGKALDDAKPGLSKKVQKVLADKTMDPYSKARLLQELTAQTEVGINAMNDQILKLAASTGHSVEVVAQQFNVSRDVARSMIASAKEYKKDRENIDKLENASVETLMKDLKITKQKAVEIQKNRGEIAKAYRMEKQLKMASEEQDRVRKEHLAKQKKLQEEINALKDRENAAIAAGDSNLAEIINRRVAEKTAELSLAKKEFAKLEKTGFKVEPKLSGMDMVAKQNETYIKKFSKYSDLTGKSLHASVQELATVKNLIGAGILVFLGTKLAKHFGLVRRFEDKLYTWLTKDARNDQDRFTKRSRKDESNTNRVTKKLDSLKSAFSKGGKHGPDKPRPDRPDDKFSKDKDVRERKLLSEKEEKERKLLTSKEENERKLIADKKDSERNLIKDKTDADKKAQSQDKKTLALRGATEEQAAASRKQTEEQAAASRRQSDAQSFKDQEKAQKAREQASSKAEKEKEKSEARTLKEKEKFEHKSEKARDQAEKARERSKDRGEAARDRQRQRTTEDWSNKTNASLTDEERYEKKRQRHQEKLDRRQQKSRRGKIRKRGPRRKKSGLAQIFDRQDCLPVCGGLTDGLRMGDRDGDRGGDVYIDPTTDTKDKDKDTGKKKDDKGKIKSKTKPEFKKPGRLSRAWDFTKKSKFGRMFTPLMALAPMASKLTAPISRGWKATKGKIGTKWSAAKGKAGGLWDATKGKAGGLWSGTKSMFGKAGEMLGKATDIPGLKQLKTGAKWAGNLGKRVPWLAAGLTAMDIAPGLVKNIGAGDYRKALADAIPSVSRMVGGLIGGSLGATGGTFVGGPVGTVAGAMAGGTAGAELLGVAGDALAEWIREKTPEEAVNEANKKVKEATKELEKAIKGNVEEEIAAANKKMKLAQEELELTQEELIEARKEKLEIAQLTKDKKKIAKAEEKLASAERGDIPAELEQKKKEAEEKKRKKRDLEEKFGIAGAGVLLPHLQKDKKETISTDQAMLNIMKPEASDKLGFDIPKIESMTSTTKSIAEGLKKGLEPEKKQKLSITKPTTTEFITPTTQMPSPQEAMRQKIVEPTTTTPGAAATATGPADLQGEASKMNPDGSITFTIKNFGSAVASYEAEKKKNMRSA